MSDDPMIEQIREAFEDQTVPRLPSDVVLSAPMSQTTLIDSPAPTRTSPGDWLGRTVVSIVLATAACLLVSALLNQGDETLPVTESEFKPAASLNDETMSQIVGQKKKRSDATQPDREATANRDRNDGEEKPAQQPDDLSLHQIVTQLNAGLSKKRFNADAFVDEFEDLFISDSDDYTAEAKAALKALGIPKA